MLILVFRALPDIVHGHEPGPLHAHAPQESLHRIHTHLQIRVDLHPSKSIQYGERTYSCSPSNSKTVLPSLQESTQKRVVPHGVEKIMRHLPRDIPCNNLYKVVVMEDIYKDIQEHFTDLGRSKCRQRVQTPCKQIPGLSKPNTKPDEYIGL